MYDNDIDGYSPWRVNRTLVCIIAGQDRLRTLIADDGFQSVCSLFCLIIRSIICYVS